MNIRLEGTRAEIRELEKVIQTGLASSDRTIKQISKFYPNEQKGIDSKGRVYLEIE